MQKQNHYPHLSHKEVMGFRSRLLNWSSNNFSIYPWRKKVSRFHGLIAEILLQRTKADQVVPVFELFRKRFRTPEILARASEKDVLEFIYPLGLHWRAKKIIMLGRHLASHGSRVPDTFEDFIKLPGVGEYTAAAFLSFHMGKRAPIIDSNVVRFYGRYFGLEINRDSRRKKWFIKFADILTPAKQHKKYNYALLDFTRLICKPRPDCQLCFLSSSCQYFLNRSN